MIVYEDGTIEGSIGGGSLELKVAANAQIVIAQNQPQKFSYDLEDDLSMHCGGTAEVYIEPITPELSLYIFGAGHIGKALAKYAPDFGFSVIIIDHRNDLLQDKSFTGATIIQNDYNKAAEELDFDNNAYIVIVTPKHQFDEAVLALCAKKVFAYLGMIGSKTKVALARKRLLDEKILTEQELEKVDMPIGIKFNAETPEEIAISILVKLIDVKNSKQVS